MWANAHTTNHLRADRFLRCVQPLNGTLINLPIARELLRIPLHLTPHKTRDVVQLSLSSLRPAHIRVSRNTLRNHFLGSVAAEDFQQVVFHSQSEGIVNQIYALIRAFITQKWLVADREILDVNRCSNYAAGKI